MPTNEPIAEAALYGVPPVPGAEGAERGRGAPPEEPRPGRPSDLFVRAVAVVCLLATVLGVLVLPGLLGSVSEPVAVWVERATAMAGYLSFGGLLLLTSTFGYELILRTELGTSRYALLGLGVVVVGLAAPSISTRLIAIPQAMLAFVAGASCLVASWASLRAPHTRAPAFALGTIGFAALLRAGAWALATLGSEGSVGGTIGRVLSTLAVVVTGLAELVAVAYYATRGGRTGRIVGNVALVLGLVVTYVAVRRPPGTGALGAVLAASIARGAPSPEPYLLAPVAHYLLPTAIFLAIVALVQRNQVASVTVGLALALASQTRLDVPLPALFALVSGLLLVRASRDERAMWSDLIAARAGKAADETDGKSRPPRNVPRPERTTADRASRDERVAVAVAATEPEPPPPAVAESVGAAASHEDGPAEDDRADAPDPER